MRDVHRAIMLSEGCDLMVHRLGLVSLFGGADNLTCGGREAILAQR